VGQNQCGLKIMTKVTSDLKKKAEEPVLDFSRP